MAISTDDAHETLFDFRDELKQEIEHLIGSSMKDILQSRGLELRSLPLKTERVVYDVLAREIEGSLIPAVDTLVQKLDHRLLENISQSGFDKSHSALVEKLRVLKGRLEQLESAANTVSAAPIHSVVSNPYADIEQRVSVGDWAGAWRRAVDVFNGVDFMIHLMGSSTPEEFFATNIIEDPLLSLQICINTAKEVIQSDRSHGIKLEIISELILSLTNPGRLNIAHQFALLKDLMHQVGTKLQSSRVREIQKIILATERLMTPPISIESTPMPTMHRFAPISPAPMYP